MGEIRKLHVTFNTQRFEVDIDVKDSVEVFKLQLYSLTGVPPDGQKILGLTKGSPLKDDIILESLAIKDGQKVLLMGKPEAAVPTNDTSPPIPVPHEPTIFEEDINAWKTSCTRIFFPNEDILQPSFVAPGNWNICFSCATTCHLPNTVAPNRDPKLKFKCTCAQIPGKECLYSARSTVGLEAIAGKLKSLVIEDLEKAKTEQAKAFAQQGSSHGQQQLINRFKAQYSLVAMYEQPELQAMALSCIPLEIQQATGKQQVIDLLAWFKTQFFKWVDKPPCDSCGGSTRGAGVVAPSSEDQMYRANTVELYVCDSCHAFTRFPRYNHPGKLLSTRRGRCGEWANAFTLCCRAIGRDARFVLDFTDHVWTEVFEEETQRYVHTDPCENQYDKPMTYEAGWGKKLSYVIAFAWDHILDVTKRYTRKWDELKQRRTIVDEDTLANIIHKFNADLGRPLTPARTELLRKRVADEYVELENYLIIPTTIQSDELQGRQSGSEEWRTQRGEIGDGGACAVPVIPITKPAPKPLPIHRKRVFNLDSTKISLVGAARFTGTSVHITPASNAQKGGVYIKELTQINKGFTIGFDFRMASRGADGFAFVVHRDPRETQALGKEGNGVGYDGIARSVVVEFDTWKSDDCGDPSGNHVSIHTRGQEPNSSHHLHSLGSVNPSVVLNDGAQHAAFIQYDAEQQTLAVWVEKEALMIVKINLPETIGVSEDGKAWLGFVGSTGGVSQLHELLRWSVNVPDN
eukprot:Phypoly_transcript_03475.p1 GENE.Phypoly_transcript_03475~~Phypoly_transcript_03475.p1  ORF type:complete len:778 (+),score=103.78 Phypoly_transcript_03475:100-2334(+)